MSDEPVVVRATFADLEQVKATRLRALEDSPQAFASTLESEKALADDEWRSRIEDGAWFLACHHGHTVGVVAAFTEDHEPDTRHLVAMWVESAARGTSVAADLVSSVISWASEQKASTVRLWVVDGNGRARRFYERLGFVSSGRRQRLPSDLSRSEEEYVLRLG